MPLASFQDFIAFNHCSEFFARSNDTHQLDKNRPMKAATDSLSLSAFCKSDVYESKVVSNIEVQSKYTFAAHANNPPT